MILNNAFMMNTCKYNHVSDIVKFIYSRTDTKIIHDAEICGINIKPLNITSGSIIAAPMSLYLHIKVPNGNPGEVDQYDLIFNTCGELRPYPTDPTRTYPKMYLSGSDVVAAHKDYKKIKQNLSSKDAKRQQFMFEVRSTNLLCWIDIMRICKVTQWVDIIGSKVAISALPANVKISDEYSISNLPVVLFDDNGLDNDIAMALIPDAYEIWSNDKHVRTYVKAHAADAPDNVYAPDWYIK